MDHRNLIAIDTHTHVEISCWNPFDNYVDEYDRAAAKYFKSGRRPTIQESIDYYREQKIGLVMSWSTPSRTWAGAASRTRRSPRRRSATATS